MGKLIKANIKNTRKSLATLLKEAENFGSDGHFTIFSFTTNWKVISGTPDFNQPLLPIKEAMECGGTSLTRKELASIPGAGTLEEALEIFINRQKEK